VDDLSLARRVTIVVTRGTGSMDETAERLAAHLPVPAVRTRIGQVSAEVFDVPALSRAALAALRADVRFVRALRRRPPALWHFPNHHTLRYAPAAGAPYVASVHDLIRQLDAREAAGYISRPNRRDRAVLRLDALGIRRASAIITPSRATKRALVERLGLDTARIAVVHHGVDHARFRPVARRLVAGPYLLYVGSDHPRKDLPTLLRAFAALKRDRRFAAVRLVKVGEPGRPEGGYGVDTQALIAELGLRRDVVLTGRVSDDDLPAYYAHAEAVVLPSRAEGFGLPVLEAMACGAPAVVSAAGALPEVAGDAGLVVAPADPGALRSALERLLGDPALRAELAARARTRAAGFSWPRAAAETLRVYAAVLEGGRAGDVEPEPVPPAAAQASSPSPPTGSWSGTASAAMRSRAAATSARSSPRSTS
jgi:glycosyltransferase involved in cell wall biosynthesis